MGAQPQAMIFLPLLPEKLDLQIYTTLLSLFFEIGSH
jgi:hypothetical protein